MISVTGKKWMEKKTNKNFVINVAIAIPAANPGTSLSLKSVSPWSMVGNVVTIASFLALGSYVKIQMNENTIQENRGGYEYTSIVDVVDNFLIDLQKLLSKYKV